MPSDSGTPKKRPNPVLSRMEENIFTVLKESGVFLSSHIEKILFTCGYTNAGVLSEFDENQLPAIVDTVRFQLGEPTLYGEMEEEEKVATFGIFYAKKPHLFQFFPGELIAINRAVEVAKQIVHEFGTQKSKRRKLNVCPEDVTSVVVPASASPPTFSSTQHDSMSVSTFPSVSTETTTTIGNTNLTTTVSSFLSIELKKEQYILIIFSFISDVNHKRFNGDAYYYSVNY